MKELTKEEIGVQIRNGIAAVLACTFTKFILKVLHTTYFMFLCFLTILYASWFLGGKQTCPNQNSTEGKLVFDVALKKV